MAATNETRSELIERIVGRLVRRHSTAVVLFHQAVAERLGIGPTDLKCLDLLREHGTMTSSELAAITRLTTGAVAGIVARLQQAGLLRREPDPQDGRKQILSPSLERMQDLGQVFVPIRKDTATLLEGFDTHQLTAIAEFLAQSTDLVYRHAAVLRSDALRPETNPPNSPESHLKDSKIGK